VTDKWATPVVSNFTSWPSWVAGQFTVESNTVNEVFYVPIYLKDGDALNYLSCMVYAADVSNTCAMAIYDSGTNGDPDSRLALIGATAVPTIPTGDFTLVELPLSSELSITADGWYWLAWMGNSTDIDLTRCITASPNAGVAFLPPSPGHLVDNVDGANKSPTQTGVSYPNFPATANPNSVSQGFPILGVRG